MTNLNLNIFIILENVNIIYHYEVIDFIIEVINSSTVHQWNKVKTFIALQNRTMNFNSFIVISASIPTISIQGRTILNLG